MKTHEPPERYIPQCEVSRRPLLVWLVVTAGAVLLVSLIIAAPVAQASGHPYLAFTIYQSFSHVCHQLPERSFFVAGHKLAVCSRCAGLYLAFAGGLSCYLLISSLKNIATPERKWLFIAATPLAIDFALGFFGIWENTHLSRFSTGALLGAALVFYVMPGLAELSLRSRTLFAGTREKARRKAEEFDSAPERINAAPSDYGFPHRRI